MVRRRVLQGFLKSFWLPYCSIKRLHILSLNVFPRKTRKILCCHTIFLKTGFTALCSQTVFQENLVWIQDCQIDFWTFINVHFLKNFVESQNDYLPPHVPRIPRNSYHYWLMIILLISRQPPQHICCGGCWCIELYKKRE